MICHMEPVSSPMMFSVTPCDVFINDVVATVDAWENASNNLAIACENVTSTMEQCFACIE